MARIIGGIGTSHVPTIAMAYDRKKQGDPDWAPLFKGYEPVARWSLRRKGVVIAAACAMMLATVPIYSRIGSEFMPPLEEGTILFMPTTLPGVSVARAREILRQQDAILASFPEVERVWGKAGRAETATDPAGFDMFETTITLKPKAQWREGMTWERLVREMDEKVSYPGMPNIWWMPIQTRTEMLATGLRSQLGIKVFAGVMLGITFHMLNGLFSHLGVINNWRPFFSAITPSALFLLAAAGMLWWVERR